MVKSVSFDPKALDEFISWAETNIKIFLKIHEIIKNIQRDPFKGIGKPEPLKHDKKGYWSRRIDGTNRLVYKVSDTEVILVACKHHYENNN